MQPREGQSRADRNGLQLRRECQLQDVVELFRVARGLSPADQVAYNRALLPITPGSAVEIEKSSRPWRLKYVRFRGPLEYVREEEYETTYRRTDPPLGRIHRGRVRVLDGDKEARVVFVAPTAPRRAT